MPIPKEALDEIALSEAEYQLIAHRLGKEHRLERFVAQRVCL